MYILGVCLAFFASSAKGGGEVKNAFAAIISAPCRGGPRPAQGNTEGGGEGGRGGRPYCLKPQGLQKFQIISRIKSNCDARQPPQCSARREEAKNNVLHRSSNLVTEGQSPF